MGISRDSTSVPKRKRISNTKLAYIAGILDGEGHFTTTYKSTKGEIYPYMRVAITNTDLALLKFLQECFGGVLNVKTPGPLSRKPCWNWFPGNIKEFLKRMKPYVRIKRKQLEVALAFHSLPYGTTEKRIRLAKKLRGLQKGDDKVQAV